LGVAGGGLAKGPDSEMERCGPWVAAKGSPAQQMGDSRGESAGVLDVRKASRDRGTQVSLKADGHERCSGLRDTGAGPMTGT
jgi:hypothetical protein